MQTLSYFEKIISPRHSASLEIVDPVEGNIYLSLELVDEIDGEHDYARYDVIDAHHAKISIVNAQKDKYLAIREPIHIGTFGGIYNLTAQMKLTPESADGSRMVRIVFFIARKGEM